MTSADDAWIPLAALSGWIAQHRPALTEEQIAAAEDWLKARAPTGFRIIGPPIPPNWRPGPITAKAGEYLEIQWATGTAIIIIKTPQSGSALAERRIRLAALGYTAEVPEGPAAVARALGVSPPDLDILGINVLLPLDGQGVVVELPVTLIEQAIVAAMRMAPAPPVEAPAEPEQPADPSRYRALHIYLAQPALLLGGAPEIHDDGAVMRELRRALEVGEIRNRIVVGAAYLPPLAGLISGQIVGELWRSDSVNFASGVLEHPPGVYRGIEICEEDARAHFRAWSPQKSPAPQPEAALAEPTESPTPATSAAADEAAAPQSAPAGGDASEADPSATLDSLPASSRHDQVEQVTEFAKAHPGWGPDRIYAALTKGENSAFSLSRDRVRKLVPPGKTGRRPADQAET